MRIELDPIVAGVVVRWENGLIMLFDPTGAWWVLSGRVLFRQHVAQA